MSMLVRRTEYNGVHTTSTKHATTMSLTRRLVRELMVQHGSYTPYYNPRYTVHGVVIQMIVNRTELRPLISPNGVSQ